MTKLTKKEKQLNRIEEKLDFMIDGLSRTIVRKNALGAAVQEKITGRQLFEMWKNKKKVDSRKKIPIEKVQTL